MSRNSPPTPPPPPKEGCEWRLGDGWGGGRIASGKGEWHLAVWGQTNDREEKGQGEIRSSLTLGNLYQI